MMELERKGGAGWRLGDFAWRTSKMWSRCNGVSEVMSEVQTCRDTASNVLHR